MKHIFSTARIAAAMLFCAITATLCTAQPTDSLTYITHSFVKIKTVEGKVIYIDPFDKNAFRDSADVVLITHEHDDHNELGRVKRKATCQIIRSENALKSGIYQSFTFGSITVTAVPAYNSNHPKESCVGYVVHFNNIKVYHAGDTGKIKEMADLAAQNITYALLPIEGEYTITPEVATEAAAMIQADHDIPIHTAVPPNPYSDTFVARFKSPNKMVIRPGETIALVATTSAVDEPSNQPLGFTLAQNYPNPFNPETSIRYTIPVSGHVCLKVYNVLGTEVAAIVDQFQESGAYQFTFNGAALPSGIYLYSLQVNEFQHVRKFILVK